MGVQIPADADTSTDPVWAFGSFRLSDSEGLKRDGVAVMLEPRTLDVLLYLVSQRDRIVSREELLEAVWGETVVEEAVLSQTIFKLRKHLGDSARNPQFVVTHHRRGYQFIAPLEPGPGGPDPSSTRSLALPVGLAILTFGLLSLLLNWLDEDDSPMPLPTLGFIPVAIQSEEPGAELIGQTFDDLLFKRLSQQPGLITRSRTLGSLELDSPPDSLSQYAETEYVDWVLRGQVLPAVDPDRVWLEMELIKMAEAGQINFPIDRFELPLPGQRDDLDRLLDARHRVAQIVGDHIGVAVADVQRSPYDPSSLESMRLLLLGLEELGQLRCGGQLAVNYLQQAVAIDPQLTTAWVGLGYAYYNEVWACGGEMAYLDQAFDMVEHALELEPLNELALPLEADLLTSLGRPRDALTHLLTALREKPDSATLHFYTSFILNYLGLLERSQWHLDQALQLDPFVLITDVSDPPLVLLYQARWQDFLQYQVAVDSAYHRFYRGYALWQLGDHDQAREVLSAFDRQDWRTASFVAYGQALLAVMDGRRADAVEKIRVTHQRRTGNGIRDGEMTFKEAWLMSLAGQEELAMDYLELTIEQGFACSVCIRNSPFVGPSLQSPRFQALLQRVQSSELEWAQRLASLQDPVQPLDP